MTEDYIARNSSYGAKSAAICIEACNNCAKSCESFKTDDKMRATADECRKCAGNCSKLKQKYAETELNKKQKKRGIRSPSLLFSKFDLDIPRALAPLPDQILV